jgi:pimeloyl-ACP methyl ester carboxylesterase
MPHLMEAHSALFRPIVAAVCGILALACPSVTHAIDLAEAVRFSREYLTSTDTRSRAVLARTLDRYDGDLAPVIGELGRREFKSVRPGYVPRQHFSDASLRERHPQDLLYFTIPKTYRPDRPTGLIVFLHGGGNRSLRSWPAYFMDYPGKHDDSGRSRLGDLFDATGMIAVGPSAPWDVESSYRWCLPEADEYLADVIAECMQRFHIDPDRVFLVGHSMGGFGSYHHIQRQPDRFAGVVVNAGSWSLGYWPTIHGTKLCIVQGVRDAERGVRWHYTDVEYARSTNRLLSRDKLDFLYMEHAGGHGVWNGREHIARFFDSAADLRRDPRHPHVVLASPVGFKRWYSFPVKHNRWLTLGESTPGQIEYDELLADDDGDFDSWRLTHSRSRRDGSVIDAVNQGDNSIVVSTQNVARFTVWLDAKMVDVSRPVTITVDGRRRFSGIVKPSLATALESYERRQDWGLIYPIRVELSLVE